MNITDLIPNYLDDEKGYDVSEIISLKDNGHYYDIYFVDCEIGIVVETLNKKDIENWIHKI